MLAGDLANQLMDRCGPLGREEVLVETPDGSWWEVDKTRTEDGKVLALVSPLVSALRRGEGDDAFIARTARVLRERVFNPAPDLPDPRARVKQLQGKRAPKPENPEHGRYRTLNRAAGMIVGRALDNTAARPADFVIEAQRLRDAVAAEASSLALLCEEERSLVDVVAHSADAGAIGDSTALLKDVRVRIVQALAWIARLDERVAETALEWGCL